MNVESPSVESVWSILSSDLRRFLRRRVADEHTADDLLQETFIRVQRGLGELSEVDNLRAWVFRIARNVVYDHYRARRTGAVPLDDSVESGEDENPLDGRDAAWLRQMIARLPGTYRDVIELAELQGLPHREIAARLGLSLSAAKSRVQRGRAELRKTLLDCCHFELDRRGNILDYERRPGGTGCGGPDPEACRGC